MGSSGSFCLWIRVLVGLVLVLNCGFCFRCVSTAVHLEDVDVDLHLARRGLLAWGSVCAHAATADERGGGGGRTSIRSSLPPGHRR